MNKKDFYSGLLMLLLSGAIFAQILRSPSIQDSSGPGPFFLPTIAALIIGALSLTLLIQSLKQPKAGPAPSAGRRMWGRLIWIMFWCALYGITIENLGYLLSTGIVTFALLAYFNRRKWVINIVFSLATPISIYILFDTLLKVPLPKGWLGP
ncbi:MAG: tripartite tricarboxylate transporter TctB family protein [Deltaproteobacteria bacterium]|nr:tripartite tricarboxylate transporter TctB family protein [Deltaproteobacteria bacterium]